MYALSQRKNERVPFMKELFAASVLLGLVISPLAAAQSAYPNKPIRLIVPQGQGGSNDILARLLAQKMAEQLGTSVVVDNKAGAGGNIGHQLAAQAAPDGYTVLYNTSSLVLNVSLYANPGYDVLKDYKPVALTATIAEILMVTPSLPTNTVAEFVAYAKQNPGKVTYASAGPGNITHLMMELFLKSNNLSAVHVPYKGGGAVMIDLVAGRTQAYFGTPLSSAAYFKDGRLRPLAVTMLKRVRTLPNVPTLNETIMPGFEASAWQGMLVPAKTPNAIVNRLNSVVLKILNEPDFRAQLEAQDVIPLGSTPEEYGRHLKSEVERWGGIIRGLGVRLD